MKRMRLKLLSNNFLFALFVEACMLTSSMRLHAQWQSIGYFDLGATTFFADNTSDVFYVGGQFHFFDDDTIVGIGQWKDSNLSPMNCGVGWDCANFNPFMLIEPTNEIIRYHDTVYVIGAFWYVNGTVMNGIAKWDGINWIKIGNGLLQQSGNNGIGLGASIINDSLYVYGVFDSIAGVEAHGLAKYNGSHWSNVHDLPQFESYNAPNFIYGISFYDGELYVAGNIYSPTDSTINDLIKWNGSQWVGVGHIQETSAIYNMLVYKNELYISGDFNLVGDPPKATHNVARFNGTTWNTVGGGTDYQINDMQVFNDYMYIAGTFDHTDGMPIQDIARWDGSRWCGYNSVFDNACNAVGMFRDTLYIGGGFWSINGDTNLRKVVRWLGGDSLFQCGNPVGISETYQEHFTFSFSPNPATTQLTITTSSNGKLTITNNLSQIIQSLTISQRQQQIPTASFPSGIYFLTFQTEKTIQIKKLLIQHE